MSKGKIFYRITPKDLHAHIFHVEIKLENANPLGQVFSLPNWVPGSYLLRDFAKHIVSISAYSGEQAVILKKLDKNHWIAHPGYAILTIAYDIYAFDLSVRCAYLSKQRAFFNGSSVFLQAVGFEQLPCELRIDYPIANNLSKWGCATTLKAVSKHKDFEVYAADNYQDLIDNPVEMADFTRFEFALNNIPHTMTISGQHTTDISRLKADLLKICQHHIDFFGSCVPFDEYLFLTLVSSKDYGGLEHKKSSSLICSTKQLPTLDRVDIDPDYSRFLSLCSHEYFHAWWMKTIKPACFHQLDLNTENYTEQLWIFEGFTSYYDELSLLRTKILSATQYLTLFAQTATKVQKCAGRHKQSLAESSFDAWTKFYQQDENASNAIVSYYTKGALLAFVLDIEIRKRTDDNKSLDNVLRLIYQQYQQTGLENDTVQKVVEHLTQSNFTEFFDAYLYGVAELPLKAAFDYVGIDLQFVHKQNDLSKFGIAISKNAEYATVREVFDKTCAQTAGLYVADKITHIDSSKISANDLAVKIDSYAKNSTIQLDILRDELPLKLSATITDSAKTHCTLSINNNPNPQTLYRQQQWFYQK